MEEIPLNEFIEAYENGYIVDIVVVKNKIYGRDPRGQGDSPKPYKTVFSIIP